MYLEAENLQCLNAFKQGILAASHAFNVSSEDFKKFHDFDWCWFEAYVSRTYGISLKSLEENPSKENWDTWWGFFDEFMEKSKENECKAILQ